MLLPIIKAIVLGLVEGVTEFLPISSTGHLILVNEWVRFGDSFTKMFDVVVQLGAILAVIVFFWNKLWPFGKTEPRGQEIFAVWKKIIVGVVPAIIIGGLFGSYIESRLFNVWVVAGALVIGGLLMIYLEWRHVAPRFESVLQVPWLIAFFIGLIQCLAMIPGTSRAAATIIGAMILGTSRRVAVEFSFFLAVPTMIAASAYSLLKHSAVLSSSEIVSLIVGFITAFLIALVVIRFFMKYIRDHSFKPFGYYRIILGVLIILYFLAV